MVDTQKVSELDPIDQLNRQAIMLIVQDGDTYRTTLDEVLKLSPTPVLKKGTIGGNWATNYSDVPSNTNAAGTMGGAKYWKTTVTLNNVPAGATAAIADFRLQALPADASGNLIPYQLHKGYVKYSSGKPTVDIWLFVYGTPTQLMSLNDKSLSPLGIINDVQYDPKYSFEYWWVE